MIQWNRGYQLTFKNLETGDSFSFTDLRITFDIEKYVDQKDKTDRGSVSIYNLSVETFKRMDCRNGYLWLDVGYDNNLARLVEGDIITVSTSKQGTEFVTELEFANGFRDMNVKKLKPTTFPEGVPVKSVLAHVAGEVGLAQTDFKGDWTSLQFLFGYPVYGTARTVLDNICKANNLEWKILGNTLTVTDRYGLTNPLSNSAYVLRKETGLLDIPFRWSEQANKAAEQFVDSEDERIVFKKPSLKKDGTPRKQTTQKIIRTGVKIKALINPLVQPNSLIKLETDSFVVDGDGYYRVRSIKYNGDTRGNEWFMEIFGDSVDKVELR